VALAITCPITIAASLMCANLADLGADVIALEEAGVDRLHFDVMDGHFVPNITLGADTLRALRPLTRLPLDVHLMTDHPEALIETFAQAGANYLSLHIEACPFLHRAIQRARSAGIQIGVALNPDTPPDAVEYTIEDVDRILVMAVDPGFAGQPFIPTIVRKIEVLRKLLDDRGARAAIEVDGCISRETLPRLAKAGASMFVGGTAGLFLKTRSFREALAELRASATVP
jgi:ribulose-phosphate 3-epimerase